MPSSDTWGQPFSGPRRECPKCGAKRGLAVNEADGFGYCHACQQTSNARGDGHTEAARVFEDTHTTTMTDLIPKSEIKYINLDSRGLRLEYLAKYGYGISEYKGRKCHVVTYSDDSGTPRCQKLRFEGKDFQILGDKGYLGLFGKSLCRGSGKRIIITEGELDAVAAAQTLGSWPVVSVPQGAGQARKYLEKDLEFLENYERVVLCFDQDEAGQKAIEECLDLFTPGKLAITKLPRKDACEMLAAGEAAELSQALWDSAVYRPEGLVSGDDILEAILNAPDNRGEPYPWEDLEALLRGIRPKEMVLLSGGTGGGKSTVSRHIAHHCLSIGKTVGYVALEESVAQSALGVYGIEMQKNLRLSDDLPRDEVTEAHKQFADRFHILDHFGSMDPEFLISKLRYLVKALHCEVVFLDHISIAISGLQIDDERKALDVLMTQLRSLIEETGVTMYVVSHLRRAHGKSHEEGAQISLSDLRGSQSLAQIPDIVVACERDSQAEGDAKNKMHLRVLKNRPVGLTGSAGYLEYQHETGTLKECPAPVKGAEAFEEQEDFGENKDF